MKTLKLTPALCPVGESDFICHNLRPVKRRGRVVGLGVAARPETFLAGGGWTPLCAIDGDGANGRLLLNRGRTLAAVDPTAEANARPQEYEGVRLPADVLCALQCGGSALIMTEKDAGMFSGEDGGRLKACAGDYPLPLLRAADGADISVSTSGCTLTQVYGNGDSLRGTDRRRVSGDVADAYARLASQAACLGSLVQPALFQYRLYDHSGNLLTASEPMLLSHSSGAQCVDVIEAVYDRDSLRVLPVVLRASAWQPRLEITPSALANPRASEVARCEVWMSPQFHPFDPAELALPYIGMRNGTQDIRVYLPGHGSGLSEGTYGSSEALLRAAVARFGQMAVKVLTVHDPFVKAATINVPVPLGNSAADEHAALMKSLRVPVAAVGPVRNRLEPPHHFTARRCCANASVVAWADITAHRFGGWPLEAYAAAVDSRSGAWHAAVAVEFSSGEERVVCCSEGLTDAPAALRPLLSYPSADAVSMTVILSAGGAVYRQKYPLTPDESGRRALYVHRSFRPHSVGADPGGVFAVPAALGAPLRLPSTLVLADKDAPLLPVVVAGGVEGAVEAVVPAIGVNQAWEYGRCRFMLASRGGIYTLTADLPRRSCNLRLSDSRGIDRRDAFCSTSTGAYVLGKGASGRNDLLKISATGEVETIATDLPFDIVGMNHKRMELWLADTRGEETVAMVVCPADGFVRYTVDSPGLVGFVEVGSSTYGVCDGGVLLALDRERLPHLPVEVALTVGSDFAVPGIVPRNMVVECAASSVDGRLSVVGTRVNGVSKVVLKELWLSGALRSAFHTRIVAPPQERIDVAFTAAVSGDFLIRNINIGYDTRGN